MKKLLILLLLLLCWTDIQAADNIRLPEMGDSAGALISPQEEKRIGQNFFWQLQKSTHLVHDPEINSFLESLGDKLVAASDSPWLHFTFFMISDPTINAFSAPGGYIGVHSGLVLATDSEDELAAVLSHEIAHTTQRHLLRAFERQKQMSIPMTAGMIAAMLLGIQNVQMGSAAMMALQAGGVQMRLNFTRADEKEADNIGMQTLEKAGFDPMAMPEFFQKLEKETRYAGGNSIPEFLRTHPVTSDRIAEATARAEKYKYKPHPHDELKFYLMREKLRVMMSNNLTDLIAQYQQMLKNGSTENMEATRYGYAMALLAAGNPIEARAQIQKLIDKDKDRLTYQLARADIDMSIGRVDAALAIYDDCQKLYPDDEALSLEQVSALLQANKPHKAIELLQRQLDLGTPPRRLYKLLAQARGDMGQKSEAHRWLAEYYYSSGRLKQAADQLRLAANFAKGDDYERAKIASRLREVESAIKEMDDNNS